MRVLVAPLDWGLGNATRMIPLIRAFEAAGAQVDIAASGRSQALLSQRFSDRTIHSLPPYPVRYPRSGRWFLPRMAWQMPGILNAVRKEKFWLQQELSAHAWDLVVSDNRYGLYHPGIYSLFVTHQVNPRSGSRWMPPGLLQRIHRRLMDPFDEIWVVDEPPPKNLAGLLSEPLPGKKTVRYIGHLSHLPKGPQPLPEAIEAGRYILVMLSGPEPQRTIFEQKVMEGIDRVRVPVVVLRGLPGEPVPYIEKPGVKILSHAGAAQIAALVQHASGIICRSGYSTLMDLHQLGRSALLVPTPGQGEQEYLAAYWSGRKQFLSMSQETFSLPRALEAIEAGSIEGLRQARPVLPGPEKHIGEWVGELCSRLMLKRRERL